MPFNITWTWLLQQGIQFHHGICTWYLDHFDTDPLRKCNMIQNKKAGNGLTMEMLLIIFPKSGRHVENFNLMGLNPWFSLITSYLSLLMQSVS